MSLRSESAIAVSPRRGGSQGRPGRLAGVCYVFAWVTGLLIFSASTHMRSSGAELRSVYRGHEFTAGTQYVLTEGAAAIALAVVVYALARSAHAAREQRLERAVLASGLGAVLVSLVQCGLGLDLAERLIPERRAHAAITVNDVINRLDGVKMFMLAGLAIASFSLVQRGRIGLPRWIATVALALAATLAVSGVGYILLLDGPALAAWVSLPLLLVWVCGTGFALERGET
jgi:hypothetical protein